jgi:serine/threonine protein phosphatase PrpC
MNFEFDIGLTSLAGKKDVNEDFAAALLPEAHQQSKGVIAAIADGVSRGGLGREAAQTTVTSLVRDYFGTPDTWDTTVALDRIIAAQNAWLAAQNRRRRPAMGLTTLTAIVLRGHSYAVAHVGDTRAYLVRAGQCTQLTQDHVVDHPDFSHQLLRAVGLEDQLVVDYSQGDVQVGDCFVLLSDGAYGDLVKGKMELTLQKLEQQIYDSQAVSARLVQDALDAGSRDNVTALVVRVKALPASTLGDAQRRAGELPIPERLKLGESVDGFVVTALVADSGINLIYQVRDPATRRLYALKTLDPKRAHDAQERAMLAHEAWLAASLAHGRAAEHLVRVHETLPNAQPRSAFYVLYDWHSGHTLQHLLDGKQGLDVAQSVTTTVTIALQIARALGRLHRQNVIHRDVKPANLHHGDDGILRLLDLGVALSGHEPESARLLHAGTPSYINPEQWGNATDPQPQPADAQSDLFALGVTLYQLLTQGKLPYGEVLPYQHGRYFRDPTAPSRHNPSVPIWLDHVVLKAVARDKRQRFETAEEFHLALERGASRPLVAQRATPLLQRDPTTIWKMAAGLSVLFNVMLVVWILFLPR